jgi:hypothetical protein
VYPGEPATSATQTGRAAKSRDAGQVATRVLGQEDLDRHRVALPIGAGVFVYCGRLQATVVPGHATSVRWRPLGEAA